MNDQVMSRSSSADRGGNYEPQMSDWMPVDLIFDHNPAIARWMEARLADLVHPFFHQSISTLRSSRPPRRECETTVQDLVNVGLQEPNVKPAGLIFHISRCGSTLIGNLLRCYAGVRVLAEAEPIGAVLRPYRSRIWPFALDSWSTFRKDVLLALINIYGRQDAERQEKLIIKFSSPAILSFAFVHSVWPDIPALIVVRDPIDVMVSNLISPTGWMRLKAQPLEACEQFGWFGVNVAGISKEEYCARVVGEFCRAGIAAAKGGGRVIDYTSIIYAFSAIRSLFGLDVSPIDPVQMEATLHTHSKDLRGCIPFSGDHEQKQRLASDEVRRLADRWVMPAYETLRSLEKW